MDQNYTNNFLKPQIFNIEINRQKKLILPKKKETIKKIEKHLFSHTNTPFAV